jgi:Arc/MetJ-type ribon-helix-helix transcriptional regulator
MAIPMEPVTVKLPPADIPKLRKQAEARGFEGYSDYVRHLVAQDRELLRKQWVALDPIFGAPESEHNNLLVSRGNPEDSQ